ncbi:MAG: T9SS type A sorting domain-containing protein, partial [Bacteroidota bacterium]
GELSAQLTNARLNNPGFNVSIDASINSENVLTVGADFVATSSIVNENNKLGLFIAILEPHILVGEDNIGLYTGTNNAPDTITNVLRTMLPSAAGQFESGAIGFNEMLSIEPISWPISNLYTRDTLTVVAYVQDLTSKVVLQANILGLSNPNTELALGIEDLKDFAVYPNPADQEVTLEFAEPVREETDWVIYDQSGREIIKGNISIGTKTMIVETSEMPSGLYFVHLYAEDRKRQVKRVIVLH